MLCPLADDELPGSAAQGGPGATQAGALGRRVEAHRVKHRPERAELRFRLCDGVEQGDNSRGPAPPHTQTSSAPCWPQNVVMQVLKISLVSRQRLTAWLSCQPNVFCSVFLFGLRGRASSWLSNDSGSSSVWLLGAAPGEVRTRAFQKSCSLQEPSALWTLPEDPASCDRTPATLDLASETTPSGFPRRGRPAGRWCSTVLGAGVTV